jgi:hypothetical protein
MKVYEAIYKDEERQGVFGISLVENPAMEDEWIALSEQEQELQFTAVDETKHLLLGAVLIPNKKIARNIDGNQFYITFTEDTIGKLAHDFIKKGFQNSSSAEHNTQLSDVNFVESWQVENPSIDKSALYGKNYAKGTWVTMAKVSPELYEQATNGTFKGFSIDALLGLEEVQFNNQIKTEMTKEDFIDGIKAAFTITKPEVVKEEAVEVVAETTEPVAEPVTETAQETVANVTVEEMKEAMGEVMAQFTTSVNERFTAIEAKFSLETEKKQEEIESLKTELSSVPEAQPIVTRPAQEQVQLETSKAKSTRERVFANLNQLN